MITDIYIGADNGISGAMAAISAHDGSLIARCEMPIARARKGNEIDIRETWAWIRNATGDLPGSCVFVIEEPGGSKSAKAAASMSGSFHAMRAMFDLNMLRWHRITPQAWQKVMLPGCKAGDTKPRAEALARQLWPQERWLPTVRCHKPSDGMIDAALIGEYGRRQRL